MGSGEEKQAEKGQGRRFFVYEETDEALSRELLDSFTESGWIPIDGGKFSSGDLEEGDRVVVHGSLSFIKEMIVRAEQESFVLGILPTPRQRRLQRLLGLPGDSVDAMEVLATAQPQPLDLLYAGENLVFYNALVGEAPPLAFHNAFMNEDLEQNKLELFFEALARLRDLRKVRADVTTAKGQSFRTALTGALVFNRESSTFASNLLQDSSYNDGQLRAILISPLSIVSYIHHLLVTIYARFRHQSLPDSVGLVKSQSLSIECDPPLNVAVDGVDIGATPVEFQVHPKAVRFCAAESFWEHNHPTQSDKETLRIDHLPQSDEAVDYARKRLPLLTHASEQEYRELFAALRQEGKLTATFVTLMILSTLLATVGLFLNSASVVIGAMLLAPLMQPIVTFSMGMLRWDSSLAYGALRTVAAGVGLVLVSAMSVAWLLPFREVTSEMAGRLHPTLLDLMVAVVSGIAAAYAKNNPKITGSLVGVAIAVALVPPLSTAGIGLGWGDLPMFYHAFLLFLTNFAGIVLAAALVFMLMGFSPLHRAKKGLTFGIIIVALVAVPLTLSFRQMARDAELIHRLETHRFVIGDKEARIDRLEMRHGKTDRLICDLVVSSPFNSREVHQLKKEIDALAGEPLQLEFVQRIRL